jgi:hypothetical protein
MASPNRVTPECGACCSENVVGVEEEHSTGRRHRLLPYGNIRREYVILVWRGGGKGLPSTLDGDL